MEKIAVKFMPIGTILPYKNNPRNNKKAIEMVVESIRQFGFNVPILVTPDRTIIAGHTRFEAAKRLHMKEIPVIVVNGLSEDLIKQYRIIDNKTGELSSWDYAKLIFELEKIKEINMEAFEFGRFEDEEDPEPEVKQSEGKELDLEDYDDDQFDIECPYCGYKWDE